MLQFHLLPPPRFRFRDVVFSHGWLRLAPYTWDAESETLFRTELLPSGSVSRLQLRETADGVEVRADAGPEYREELERRVRWVLALDEQFDPFHQLCEADPGLREAAEHGKGRILRCPTVWEDLVKTLFSVNTTWRQTVAMTDRFVRLAGVPHPDGSRAFPTPEAAADFDEVTLQRECRVGYRAGPLRELARAVAESRLDLEALKDPALSEAEVEGRLRALRGIGPYAAANVLMLLGRYDHLPVDSWFRKTVRDAWFGGRDVPDRELVLTFDRFRPYRTLVYLFYDWEGAMRREVWEE
ncbi:MAG: DNA-3-methyladenine glycosylase family protein [Armatimonadota bacterium]